MANPLAITLLTAGAVVAPGHGDAVDISSARSAMRALVRVTAVSAGGLVVRIETSADGVSNWREASSKNIVTAMDATITAGGLRRYVRVRWELMAGASGIEAGVAATAEQLYCEPSDLTRYGLPDEAISDLNASLEDRVDSCLAATDEAEGYLASRYTMPLTSWGDALRLHSSKLAIVAFLDRAGWQPDGPDNVVMGAYNRALAWLKGVASGVINPPGIVDSTPTVSESAAAYVTGNAPRGW